jgi:hypothetical protein
MFMKSCKVLVSYACIGFGLPQDVFERGLSFKPDVIATDAGSTDSGPYYLGTGNTKYSENSIKRDVRQSFLGAHRLSIPLIIGSCWTCGVDSGVDRVEKILRDICKEENIHGIKISKIYSEQNPDLMRQKYIEGKIIPLKNAPQIDENTFSSCSHIVALGGAEPIINALHDGADIVLSGRCTDTAVLAAFPVYKGCSQAAAWHGGKVCECGPCCTDMSQDNAVILTVDEDGFEVKTLAEGSNCSPYTCSAHMLYENSDPFELIEPSHILNVQGAVYTQLPNGDVRVEGARYIEKPYTMKLEGSGLVGYQTISLVAMMNKDILSDPMKWIRGISTYMTNKLREQKFPMDDFSFDLRPYGWNAITGVDIELGSFMPKELCFMFVVTAKTQELAREVAKAWNPQLLHYCEEEGSLLRTYAFPFSPNEIDRGALYEFKLNHAVQVDSPLELVRFESVIID